MTRGRDFAPFSSSSSAELDLPHVADGLTAAERTVLVALAALGTERPGRAVAAAALYGRVVERVSISVPAFERLLARMAARGLLEGGGLRGAAPPGSASRPR